MAVGMVTVFGGSGFLGRRVSDLLAETMDVRVAVRHPGKVDTTNPRISAMQADVTDSVSARQALAGSQAAVNCVSLYEESRNASFFDVHVRGAENVARAASEQGLSRLVLISGIGADPEADDAYIRARGQGEGATTAQFSGATVLRPSVMFARDDAFLTTLAGLVRRAPVIPLFGDGDTRLQPVYVGDVANAVAASLLAENARARTFELAGPDVLTYRDLLGRIANRLDRRPKLVPVPFAVWQMLARAGQILPRAPIAPAQVALMRTDNVADPDKDGLAQLGVTPTPLDSVLAKMR